MSSIYLHIPFCSRKCPYCDFYSQVGSQHQLDEYVELLDLHLQWLYQAAAEPRALETVFFGGGTPSLLSAAQVDRLLQRLTKSFGIAATAEISLEANPGTLQQQQLLGYRAAGVNRLSLGVQSLRDEQLRLLGRIHSAAEARQAVELAHQANFENLSLDLMFNLPGQTCETLEAELTELLSLQPQHLALYGLSYEEGTPFAARQQTGELVAVDEEESAEQYRMLHQRLLAAGFEHYEISNFARLGYRCRHNQVYWQRSSCLAAGCGAHSFTELGWGERRVVPPDLDRFRSRLTQRLDPAETLEQFDRHGAMAETLYLALRTADGIDRELFVEKFGEAPEKAYPEAFAKLAEHLQRSGDRWSFKADSWLLYDYLVSHFL